MKIIIRFFFCIALLCTTQVFAQPFQNDIKIFKERDSVFKPLPNAILFVGSSSFTFWRDVNNYFPGYPIFNRGFGGSSLPDVIRYANDIILPYHPKQIFIYCGENDFAASDTVTAAIVFERFKQLYSIIRKGLGKKVNVVYVSMKPSPSRLHLMPAFNEANEQIKQFLSTQKHTAFADVYHPMLNADGTPNKELFIEDNLHMNAKGYAIWQKVLAPFLLK